jgi:hypothetical protein
VSICECQLFSLVNGTVKTHLEIVESEGFWRCCMTLRITGFLDFVHCPESWTQGKKKSNVSETESVSVRMWRREGEHLFCWVL